MNPTRYRAFISYSQTKDDKLAAAIQSGLHHLAKPRFRLRALSVFHARTNLAASPGLWPSLEAALDRSDYLVLLSSPEAAASKWVTREVQHWLARDRNGSRILIVLTGGELEWNDDKGDFDWSRTNALPRLLAGVFESEPLYVDLRWAQNATELSLRNPLFRSVVLDLATPLHGRPKEDLDGDDVRLLKDALTRRRRAIVGVTAAGLIGFLALLGLAFSMWRQTTTLETTFRGALEHVNKTARGSPALGLLVSAHVLERLSDASTRTRARSLLVNIVRDSPWEAALETSPFETRVAWSRNDIIVAGTYDGAVQLWDPTTFTLKRQAVDKGDRILNMRSHPGLPLVAGITPPGNVVLVHTGSEPLIRLDGHEEADTFAPQSLSWCTAGPRDWLFSGSASRVVRQWDRTGSVAPSIVWGPKVPFLNAVDVSPDCRHLAVTAGEQLFLNEVGGAELSKPVFLGVRTMALRWSPGPDKLEGLIFRPHGVAFRRGNLAFATGDDRGIVRLWSIFNGEAKDTEIARHESAISDIAWSPAGDRLASISSNGNIFVWEIHNSRSRFDRFAGDSLTSVAWDPAGDRLVTGAGRGPTKVWKRDKDEAVRFRALGNRRIDEESLTDRELIDFARGHAGKRLSQKECEEYLGGEKCS